jgi:hypothetical protein
MVAGKSFDRAAFEIESRAHRGAPMLFALLACTADSASDRDSTGRPTTDDSATLAADDSDPPADDSAPDDSATNPPVPETWTFLVFMNGDNNLESYVTHDLNELELVGSSAHVNVVVQADRIEGYDERVGDWTGTRRYFVSHDGNENRVTSKVVAELGELDMGDPAVLTDFLLWAKADYPADHFALVLWNHGDGWTVAPLEPREAISHDDSSGSSISIAEGELASALAPFVDAHGPLDLIGFDACNMATFEVAHAMAPWARTLVGSQSTVGWEGLQYADALAYLEGGGDARGLADVMAATEVAKGGELNASAIDLAQMTQLASALDAFATTALEAPERIAHVRAARTAARAAETAYHDWYVDLGDFADVAATSTDTTLGSAAAAVRASLAPAVVGAYGNESYAWVSGLGIHLATQGNPAYLESYQDGAGATWSQATHWDELLDAIKSAEDDEAR